MEYRHRFGKDIFVDLIAYRLHGHNEVRECVIGGGGVGGICTWVGVYESERRGRSKGGRDRDVAVYIYT